MQTLRYLLLFYGFMGIFISGGLYFRISGIKNLFLSIFILLLSVEMLDFLYATSAIARIFPLWSTFGYFPVGMLYGPLLLFHFLVFLKKKLRWAYLLHFTCFITMIVYLWPIYSLPTLERITYSENNFYTVIMPLNYLRMAHQLIYAVWILILVNQNIKTLNLNEKRYCILISGIYFFSTLLISWYTEYAESWRTDFIYYYLLIATMSFFVGYLLYTDANFFKKISIKYLNSGISQHEMEQINNALIKAMNEDLFLNKTLTLQALSESINHKPHHVSQTFSKFIKLSFNDFINQHRIDRAKIMLNDPSFSNYKIEAIGMEVGFNNKVTFNNAFKKYTKQTPSQFKKTT